MGRSDGRHMLTKMVKSQVNHIGYVPMGDLEIRHEPQETLDESNEVVAELTDGTRLLKTEDGKGIVAPDGLAATIYESWEDARLAFGLWMRTGGYTTGEAPLQHIPIEVASEGQGAIAAYLLVGAGIKRSRSYVARHLDVTEQTVSNYANRVRWHPAEQEKLEETDG